MAKSNKVLIPVPNFVSPDDAYSGDKTGFTAFREVENIAWVLSCSKSIKEAIIKVMIMWEVAKYNMNLFNAFTICHNYVTVMNGVTIFYLSHT